MIQIETTIGAYIWKIPEKEREAFREAYHYLGLDLGTKILIQKIPTRKKRDECHEVIIPLGERSS
ncbi:MAG: hypothetical protein ACRDF4_03895 [Rhabdochlamydiaceae bacterium]